VRVGVGVGVRVRVRGSGSGFGFVRSPAASTRDNIFRSPGRRGLPAHCTRHTFLSTPPAPEQFFYCVAFEAFRVVPPRQNSASATVAHRGTFDPCGIWRRWTRAKLAGAKMSIPSSRSRPVRESQPDGACGATWSSGKGAAVHR
jgi:hypothetical protein